MHHPPRAFAGAFLALALVAAAGRADSLDDIRARGELRWGGDATGGAPYLIDQGQGKPPTGFEADLADYLARKLGVRSRFVQKQWEMLPQDLQRGDVDLVLNGYEWSPDREQVMASTIPYYVYRLQLLAGPHSTLTGMKDLHGKRVGVLSDSAAHRYLKREFGDDPTVRIVALGEEGTTGVMKLVQDGKQLDATLQDLPAAIYYVAQNHGFGDLKVIGAPVEPGYYVAYVRRDDARLRDQINDALRAALTDGTLRAIYERYGLWNADQEELGNTARHWPPSPEAGAANAPKDEGMLRYGYLLARAALTTIGLSCLAMPLAIAIGLFIAVGRLYGPGWLDWLLAAYVEFLRGTPLLLQLIVIFYFLPNLGIQLPAFWAGVFGLAINYSAYEAENYRAGLLALPRGQLEAALALGMSTWTALRRVIIPQAVRIVIPPVTNDFIALFKDTSVCSVISVLELTGQYRGLMVNHPQWAAQFGIMTAALYLLMSYPLSLAARRLEHKFPRLAA